jgi:predicted RNA-binding Zn-ribbon protein involved in translation (DUF1610 family)
MMMLEEEPFESVDDESEDDESEAPRIAPNETIVAYQCWNCSYKYEIFFHLKSVPDDLQHCPHCGSHSAKRVENDEEAGEENN